MKKMMAWKEKTTQCREMLQAVKAADMDKMLLTEKKRGIERLMNQLRRDVNQLPGPAMDAADDELKELEDLYNSIKEADVLEYDTVKEADVLGYDTVKEAVVLEGWGTTPEGFFKTWKPHWFVLTDEPRMKYYTKKNGVQKGEFSLMEAIFHEDDACKKPNAIAIKCLGRTYSISYETNAMRSEWLKALQDATKGSEPTPEPTKEQEPSMEPDYATYEQKTTQ